MPSVSCAARGKPVESPGSKKKKGADKALAPAEPAVPPPPAAIVQGDAGKPVQVGDWQVCVESARVGTFNGGGPEQFLFIALRVTNLAAGPRNYRYWSRPGKNTVVTNQNLAYLPLVPGTAPKEEERKLNSKESYPDILVLEGAAARFELDLNLLLPTGQGGFRIHIPSTFVSWGQ